MAAHSRFVLSPPHKWHVQEDGRGTTLLLIHGAGGATQSWRHLFPLLAQNHHVIAVDLPGQGFTKQGAQQRLGLPQMAEDLQRLCDTEGWKPVALVGHSAGGAIALEMARHLDPAPTVIGINAALSEFKGVAGVVFPVLAKALAMTPWVANIFTATSARPGSVQRLIEGTGSSLPPEDLGFYRKLVSDKAHVDGTLGMMAQWNLRDLLASLRGHPSKTLLLAGDQDKAVPPSTSKTAAQQMPDGQFKMLEGLGHLAHEEDAPQVAAEIEKILINLR